MTRTRLAAIAALSLAAPLAGAAGNIYVVNESSVLVHPWFRSFCMVPGSPGHWVFFGGVGPGSTFGWSFSDPGLMKPGCARRTVEFTYTTDLNPPPDAPRAIAVTVVSPDTNAYFQVGKAIVSAQLPDPTSGR